MIFVALVYLALRYSVLGGLGIPVSAQYMGGRLTYFERLLTSGRVFIQYLILTFYPLHLAGDYDYNAIPIANFVDWDAWLGLVLIAATVVTAYFYRHRNWAVSLGLSFALIAFIPASNWIMPISILMAERFLYLPMIGLALVGATALSQLEDRRLRRLVGIGALSTAIVLCNSHDYIRRDDFTFFKNMVRVVPSSAKARLGYGFALTKAGRNDEAERELEAGLRIIPDYPELLNNVGVVYTGEHKLDAAMAKFEEALRLKPNYADAMNNLGNILVIKDRPQEAISYLEQALRLRIDHPEAKFNMGAALLKLNRPADAITNLKEAVRLKPDYAEAHGILGVAWYTAGQLPEAKAEFEQAVRLKPNYGLPHRDLRRGDVHHPSGFREYHGDVGARTGA